MKKEEIKPEYQSLTELIATMKEIVHREYFSGIKEQVVIDGIELWMREAARVASGRMVKTESPDQVVLPDGLWSRNLKSEQNYVQTE